MEKVEERSTHNNSFYDLVDLLWSGRRTIIAVTTVFCGLAVVALLKFPSPKTVETQILEISLLQAERYSESNELGFYLVTREMLQQHFLDALQARDVFVQAMDVAGFIDRADIESQNDYVEALEQLAENVQILPPVNADGSLRGSSRPFWTIRAVVGDEEAWLETLEVTYRLANESVAHTVREAYEAKVRAFQKKKKFLNEDLNVQLSNVAQDYELEMAIIQKNLDFDLEDIRSQIANAMEDYQRAMQDRLVYLEEQAKIARELNVAKNTLEAQTFAAANGLLANVDLKQPFYLRGYEAIEKEAELIRGREDLTAFVPELRQLQAEERRLLQDRTLERADREKNFLKAKVDLEKQIREIEQDLTLARAAVAFEATPLFDTGNFTAAKLLIKASETTSGSSRIAMLLMVMLVSLSVSCFYVIVNTEMRQRAGR